MPRQGAKSTVADSPDSKDKLDDGKVGPSDGASSGSSSQAPVSEPPQNTAVSLNEQAPDKEQTPDNSTSVPAKNDSGENSANAADDTKNGQEPRDSSKADEKKDDKKEEKKDEKKHPLTWERTIEIAKLVATVWVAVLGSYVTMQFNERQHELNRIEAIAKMLPHVSSQPREEEPKYMVEDAYDSNDTSAARDVSSSSEHARARADKHKVSHSAKKAKSIAAPRTDVTDGGEDMGRDGAIWAIFRTANNRVMLRDLAALFPEDIYRVVSSIAVAGELDHDEDALVALQVSSEKLAAKFSTDPKEAELASRLYGQALRLKERKPNDPRPLHVIDLTTNLIEVPSSDEQIGHLVKAINDLADLHLSDNRDESTSSSGHWQAKDLFKRARQIGLNNNDTHVRIQVARADLALARLYSEENSLNDSAIFTREAHELEDEIMKHKTADPLKEADANGDGYASREELNSCVDILKDRLAQIERENPSKGVKID